MAQLIDTSLWIDLTRARSPAALKAFVAPRVNHPDACLCEPIIFELLRLASDEEAQLLGEYFATLPVLTTPADLWNRAALLGRQCRKAGVTAAALDLLIAAIAIHHDAELITFDADFQPIARAAGLRVAFLERPEG